MGRIAAIMIILRGVRYQWSPIQCDGECDGGDHLSIWEALGELDRGQPRVGEQLICALREAIEQGRLAPGSRLPSSRDLAVDLGVSRGLVVGVYERLVAEGRLASKRGSGTVVTGHLYRPDRSEQVTATPVPRTGTDPRTVRAVRHTAESGLPPLHPGVPDLGMFPRTAWRRAYERALTLAADTDFDYGDPAGAFRLRAELSAYLGRIRAARVDVDRLIVTSGSTQAFSLLASGLLAAGVAQIGVEDPGSVPIASCLAECGVEVVGLPVDADGISVAALSRSGLRAVLVTPAHQYPTGVVLTPARRGALLDWARRVGGLVVEDDYDAELRYDREPVGCLQGLAPEHVVLVGSVSRTLAPALRLGWLVPPRRWHAGLRSAKRVADGGGPALEQLAFAELLAATAYDRHLRRMRRSLRERRESLVTAVRRYLPAARISGIAAGLHITIELPSGVDDALLAERARAGGLDPVALSTLRYTSSGQPGLVLGYASHPPQELARAVRMLAHLVPRES